MNVGFGQILVIVFVTLLFFGNLPNLARDLKKSIKFLKESFNEPKKEKMRRPILKNKRLKKPGRINHRTPS
jgi:Sec-independent protein translocase protein TatA